jgi:hypothetical protein
MKKIQLTKGFTALVSDDCAHTGVNWSAWKHRRGYWYAVREVRRAGARRVIYLHREVVGATRGQIVDHINGDTLDNRAENLRICTNAENLRNRGKTKANKSGYKGVYKNKTGWVAQITVNFKCTHLGTFETAALAGAAYDAAARRVHGAFAKTN